MPSRATGIFCFFPIQYLNDNGSSVMRPTSSPPCLPPPTVCPTTLSTISTQLSIIVFAPILNSRSLSSPSELTHPLRPAARITTGLTAWPRSAASVMTVLNYYAYQQSPCGAYGSSDCLDRLSGVASITIWWMAVSFNLADATPLAPDGNQCD